MDLNTQSLEILKLISDTSESLCTNKLLFPKENGDRNTAERILVGLMTCLVAVMGDNAKLMCRKYNFHDYVRILKIYSLAGAEIRNLENGVNSQREKILYLENEVYSKNNKLSYLESQNKKLAEKNKDTVALKNKEISKLK